MFPLAILLTAVAISAVAAFFSVTGLGSLFAGAQVPVVIMASVLEIGKLVTASLLTRHWNDLSRVLRIYFSIAVVVLILITSAGIYGFLTGAYQTTADKFSIVSQQVSAIELRKQRYQEQLQVLLKERQEVTTSISTLSSGLANNRVQYVDEQGRLITSTSSATRNALQQQLNNTNQQRESISNRIEQITDSITALDLQIIEINSNNEVAAEIGPLRYLSTLSGLSMDKIVNIFSLLIVFVFDPLAISLIIGFNRLQLQHAGPKEKKVRLGPIEKVWNGPKSEADSVVEMKPDWNPESWFKFVSFPKRK